MTLNEVPDSGKELIDPIPRPRSGPFTVTMRPQLREIVFFDNGKPNSMAILRAAQSELRSRGIAVREEIVVKPYAGVPISGELLGMLSQERGLLLAGVND
jgi:hypothetical protein